MEFGESSDIYIFCFIFKNISVVVQYTFKNIVEKKTKIINTFSWIKMNKLINKLFEKILES